MGFLRVLRFPPTGKVDREVRINPVKKVISQSGIKIRIFYKDTLYVHAKGNDHLEVWQTSLSTNTRQLKKGFIEYSLKFSAF